MTTDALDLDLPIGPAALLLPAALTIVVFGQPAPQGSKKAFVNPKTKRAVMVESSGKRLRPWRADVKDAAEKIAAGQPPLTVPLTVRMVFTFARPAGHFGTGRNAGLRKPSAATRPANTGTGDLSKLARATEDAITSAGLWKDDALVVEYERLAKVWVGEDPEALDRPGCRIVIRPAEPWGLV